MDRVEIARPRASYEAVFPGNPGKWLFGMGTDNMVTNGGPQIHLQKARYLSKEWGAPNFIRKIRRGGSVYLAEVQNSWVDGKVVQKHIRYVGKEVDNKPFLTGSKEGLPIFHKVYEGHIFDARTLRTSCGSLKRARFGTLAWSGTAA